MLVPCLSQGPTVSLLVEHVMSVLFGSSESKMAVPRQHRSAHDIGTRLIVPDAGVLIAGVQDDESVRDGCPAGQLPSNPVQADFLPVHAHLPTLDHIGHPASVSLLDTGCEARTKGEQTDRRVVASVATEAGATLPIRLDLERGATVLAGAGNATIRGHSEDSFRVPRSRPADTGAGAFAFLNCTALWRVIAPYVGPLP